MKEYASTEDFLSDIQKLINTSLASQVADIQQLINNSLASQALPIQSETPSVALQQSETPSVVLQQSETPSAVLQQPDRIIEGIIAAPGSFGVDTSARIMNILF